MVTTVFPYAGLLRFLLSPKPQIPTQSNDSDNELKQTMFQAQNAKLFSESAVFAPCTYAPPVGGGFQGSHRKANLLLGTAPALCRNARISTVLV